MKMTTIMTVVAAMSTLAFAAEATDTTLPATDTAATMQPATEGTVVRTVTTRDCGMLGQLNIDTVTVEAANGDPVAQFTMAYLTDNGLADMPQDADKARDMYAAALPGLEKAAEAGNAHACRALAHMYEHGKGVEKDADKAAHYKAMCEKCCKDADGKCKPDCKKGDCCKDGDGKKM
ncbi:MAG: hypothetical protein MJ051_04435 [Akkermansia sp.]|nr:hypothetical protein [Akkermansia sp.]